MDVPIIGAKVLIGHSQHTVSEMRTTLGDDRNENEDQYRDTPLARQLEKGEATTGLTGITDIGRYRFGFDISFFLTPHIHMKNTSTPATKRERK